MVFRHVCILCELSVNRINMTAEEIVNATNKLFVITVFLLHFLSHLWLLRHTSCCGSVCFHTWSLGRDLDWPQIVCLTFFFCKTCFFMFDGKFFCMKVIWKLVSVRKPCLPDKRHVTKYILPINIPGLPLQSFFIIKKRFLEVAVLCQCNP